MRQLGIAFNIRFQKCNWFPCSTLKMFSYKKLIVCSFIIYPHLLKHYQILQNYNVVKIRTLYLLFLSKFQNKRNILNNKYISHQVKFHFQITWNRYDWRNASNMLTWNEKFLSLRKKKLIKEIFFAPCVSALFNFPRKNCCFQRDDTKNAAVSVP